MNLLNNTLEILQASKNNFVKKLINIPYSVYIFMVILLIAVVLFISFNKSINANLDYTDSTNISSITSQEQAALNNVIESRVASLVSITKTLVMLDENKDSQVAFLQNVQKTLNLDTILLVDIEGIGFRSDNSYVNMSENPIFKEAITGKVISSDLQKSAISNNTVVLVGVPVRHAGEILGVLMAEFSTAYITQILSDYTDDSETAFIIDSNKQIAASSSDVYNSLNFLRDTKLMNGMTYSEFLDYALKKRWGGTSFTLNGDIRIIEFRPLNINGWTLFLVSHDLLENPVRNISDEVQYITIGMLLIFIFFSIYIILLKRKTIREVEQTAFYDELTLLPNSVKFKQDVEGVIKKNPNMKYIMQKLDLENFKAINEIFDYETGNKILKKMAEALLSLDDDSYLCARNRNDEFFMFSAQGFLDDDLTRTNLEKYFKSLLPEFSTYEFNFRYGRYFIQKGERDVTDMISKTSVAHSMAKSLGHKNSWDYDDSYRQEVRRTTELINMSKSALEHKEFAVYLQPKYNLKEEKVTGAEALVRWIKDDGHILLPDEFIPVFETNGFVVAIDFFVLRTVCARIKSWLEKGYKVLPISVNFSRLHLKNPKFIEELKKTCDMFGDIRHLIEVELTETAVTENADDLTHLLEKLHDAGFTVAIDDFGAGYSSLGMLKDFKVDVLKLDHSFFEDNREDKRGNIVVNGISTIAHELGMTIVAEGIEISEQLNPLDVNHFELAQGFLFAKPMPMDEFEQKYLD